jgi:hypothetical protein
MSWRKTQVTVNMNEFDGTGFLCFDGPSTLPDQVDLTSRISDKPGVLLSRLKTGLSCRLRARLLVFRVSASFWCLWPCFCCASKRGSRHLIRDGGDYLMKSR